MKKSWKKILCSLMLAPCLFWATACGKDPEDPNNLTTDLTVEQQQEAYTTLRTLASSMLENDGSKDQVYKLENGRWTNKIYDFTDSGLTGNALEEAKILTSNIDYTVHSVTSYVGYKANNTGYNLTQTEVKGTADEDVSKTTTSSITKYNGQKYVNYENDGVNKVASYVSNDHAKNEYVLGLDDLNLGLDNEFIEELLELVGSDDNYDEFKSVLNTWTFRLMTRLQVFGGTEEDLDDFIYNEMKDLTATYKLSLVDGNYSLSLDTSAIVEDRVSHPLGHIADSYFRANVGIVFSKDRIKSINIDYNNGIVTEFTCESYWHDSEFCGVVFTDDDVMRCDSTYKERAYIEFGEQFDNDFFNQNVNDYLGTGENGVVENNLTTININVGNIEKTINVPYGVNLWSVVGAAVSEYTNGTDLEMLDMFSIKDGVVFNIGEDEVVPSYDITVNITLGVPPVEKVSTSVTIYITNTESEEICTFFIGDNLYDTFKAVWGLEDEQIVGIYSDAGLQNKLATSTLITEEMVVYIVLEDGWSPIPPEMV